MGKADLHIHSIYSYDGIVTVPAILKHVADDTDLTVIALTDHDTMDGVAEARALAPRYGLEVIPGCEISTAEGHLIALYLDRPVQPGLTLIDTVKAVGRQGGLCIAPHPMAWGQPSLSFPAIWKALSDPEAASVLVGVETLNGGLVDTRKNNLVASVAKSMPLAQVGSSDAHTLSVIGQASTIFPGRTAADLRRALLAAGTAPHEVPAFSREGSINPMSGAAILFDYVSRYLLKRMGWVVWNSSPRFPLTYERFSKVSALSRRLEVKHKPSQL